jgi:hypothetical protein
VIGSARANPPLCDLFGRLVNALLDAPRHQGWVSSPWRFRVPSCSGLINFQGI